MDAIDSLMTTTSNNMMALETLGPAVDTLQEEVEALEDAALIEDYFFVSDTTEEVEMQPFFQLVGPICIEGSTVLDFRLAVTLNAP